MWCQALFVIVFIPAHQFTSIAPKLDQFKPQRFQNVGTKFKIFCSQIDGFSEQTRFTWFKDGRMMTENEYRIDTNHDVSSLIIDQLSPADSANYTCHVENSAGKDSTFTVLSVKGQIIIFQFDFVSLCGAFGSIRI